MTPDDQLQRLAMIVVAAAAFWKWQDSPEAGIFMAAILMLAFVLVPDVVEEE